MKRGGGPRRGPGGTLFWRSRRREAVAAGGGNVLSRQRRPAACRPRLLCGTESWSPGESPSVPPGREVQSAFQSYMYVLLCPADLTFQPRVGHRPAATTAHTPPAGPPPRHQPREGPRNADKFRVSAGATDHHGMMSTMFSLVSKKVTRLHFKAAAAGEADRHRI